MKQVGILASGCQSMATNIALNKLKFVPNLLYFNDNHIFYASTLAIYVLNSYTYVVERLLTFDHKPILSFCLCPNDPNIIAVCCHDGSIYLCDVQSEKIISSAHLKNAAHLLWDTHDVSNCTVVAMDSSIKLYEWWVVSSFHVQYAIIHDHFLFSTLYY